MIRINRIHALIGGAVLILAVNAIALIGVSYNRSGTPESTLMLSQRELTLPYYWHTNAENTGISLRLNWRMLQARPDKWQIVNLGARGFRSGVWLDEKKLISLGFHAPSGQPKYNRRSELKTVYLVLEMDGPAYQQSLDYARWQHQHAIDEAKKNPQDETAARRIKVSASILEREENEASRLFAVDAGLTPEALREQYPDRARHAIIRAQIRASEISVKNRPSLAGNIASFMPGKINVPHKWHAVLGKKPSGKSGKAKAKYTFDIAFGKRLEPWVTSAKKQP